jgi:hypothetical protein
MVEKISPSLILRNAILAQTNCSLLERLIQPYLMGIQSPESKKLCSSLPLSPKFSFTGAAVYPKVSIPLELFGVECQLHAIQSMEENLFHIPTQTSPPLSSSSSSSLSSVDGTSSRNETTDKTLMQIASFGTLDFISRSCSLFPLW